MAPTKLLIHHLTCGYVSDKGRQWSVFNHNGLLIPTHSALEEERVHGYLFNPANTHPLDRALTGKSITRSIETSYTTTVQSRRSHITLSWQTTQVNDYLALDGSSFIVRNSGHMFAWDDLKRATPSVLRQKDRLAGYVSGQRKPPGLVYLVYSIPSQISLMPWEVVVVDLCLTGSKIPDLNDGDISTWIIGIPDILVTETSAVILNKSKTKYVYAHQTPLNFSFIWLSTFTVTNSPALPSPWQNWKAPPSTCFRGEWQYLQNRCRWVCMWENVPAKNFRRV